MICHYCQPHPPSLARAYNIELVHERFIPTYLHTQIFAPVEMPAPQRIRCTPTFHSQIMRVDGYAQSKRTPANCNPQKRPGSAKPVVYKNYSKGRTQDEFYNRRGNCCYRSDELWYDSAKEDLFKKLECCCRGSYAHDRKQVDLASNPVFGGGIVDVCNCALPESQAITAQIPKQALYEEEKEQEVKPTKVQEVAQVVKSKPQPAKCVPIHPSPKKQSSKHVEIQTIPHAKSTLKKTNAFNRTIVEGWPAFTIVRKRDW